MKVVKQHPDRHIIRSFEKKRKPRHVWTRKENELFINTVKRCGKDYKKLKYALKTKTAEQLTSKMSLLLNQPYCSTICIRNLNLMRFDWLIRSK